MDKGNDRWSRSGVRLAMLVLIAAGVYFLGLFVQQSVKYYRLTQEVKAANERVEQKRQEVERLKARLQDLQEDRALQVKKNLPYKEEGERVAIPVRSSPPEEPAASPAEASLHDLAGLPVWQQWLRLILTPPPAVP